MRLIIYSILLPALLALTILFACLSLADWAGILLTWVFFTPVFIDLFIMALGRKRQNKITAVKYLVYVCIYIDTIQKADAEANENRKKLDLAKINERERMLIIEHRLTEPIDIKAIPLNIVNQYEGDILKQLKVLFGRGAATEYAKIKESELQRHLLEIIKTQARKIKITEQEKVINNLQFDKIGISLVPIS